MKLEVDQTPLSLVPKTLGASRLTITGVLALGENRYGVQMEDGHIVAYGLVQWSDKEGTQPILLDVWSG